MRKKIKINNKDIDYILKTSRRARIMRLSVGCGGLVATKPFGMGESAVEKFIRQKANWVLSKLEYFKQFKGGAIKDNRGDYLKQRGKALEFVRERVDYFNKIYNFKFNSITVRNQKTRWGSCSANGNLNFNYKILSLPSNLADYIVVHELCHLRQLNHSQKFWRLVAQTFPNHREIRRELKHSLLRLPAEYFGRRGKGVYC